MVIFGRQISWRVVFLVLGGLVVLLHLVDGMVTQVALRSGNFVEANVLMRVVADEWWFSILKVGVAGGLVWWLYRRFGKSENGFRIASIGLGIFLVLFVIVVAWNGVMVNYFMQQPKV